MSDVKIVHDGYGHTLTVWIADSSREYVCEETSDEVILMKDSAGRVIGFEKLNFSVADPKRFRVAFETTTP
jgi:hypothetical protein